ncbi:extracellular solute-binding protein [Ahrensia sp. R2A130]|uniref:extracellular solute-binding protein n=1 Tax=Ahrensia sp. R2A130 TaxID=744979 RepID=UPI0001E0E088|nr:extracellular solute-binding protein [Ahrensia sp. R2A130]EFL89830.1 putative binding protein [Ahrensia sp. R2A130]
MISFKTLMPATVAVTLALSLSALPSWAEEKEWISTSSLIGKSKYEDSNQTHYDYVNPDAPKGGTLNSTTTGTFDSFNPFIVQGVPAAGLNSQGGILWDTLMEKGIDEPSTTHPLIAEAFSYPDDYSTATYRLNPAARWHDGKPITTEDVKWSLEILKQHSPTYDRYFADVKEARIDSEREITFIFAEKNNRELPLILGDLPVLPKHWWEAPDSQGNARDFNRSTLDIPLGSGPYKISKFDAGTSIEWERVADYWAVDTFTRKGRNNFDRLSFTYFKDPNAEWEAFKKGGLEDIRLENRAEFWARRYDFPAFDRGEVVKKEFPTTSGYGMQAWFLNSRLPKFSDRRVRKALGMALNFEAMNRNLFFDQYERAISYFGGTELQSTGLPQGRELEILEEFRDRLPPEVFTEEFKLPEYKERSDERKYLREAFQLLKEAGWTQKDGSLVNSAGEKLSLQIIGNNPSSEKVNAPWLNALRKLGIDASFRVVDTAQLISRAGSFDYDVISTGVRQSQSPGNEQREYWGSGAAKREGSRNYSGISDPAIDELIEKLIFAKDREELVYITRALDRVLLHGYYVVPQWYLALDRVAHWDKFGIPEKQPTYTGHDPYSWWIIPEKEAALNARN